MQSTSAIAVIPKLNRIVAVYGRPSVVKSVIRPSFSEDESAVCNDVSLKHSKVIPMVTPNVIPMVTVKVTPMVTPIVTPIATPTRPEASGEVERFMRTFGKVLHNHKTLESIQVKTPDFEKLSLHHSALIGRPIKGRYPTCYSLHRRKS